MSFMSLPILPGEHYISWYVRQAQFQAHPDIISFIQNCGVTTKSFKTYDVINDSMQGFLISCSDQIKALQENTLWPFWQFSFDSVIPPEKLLDGRALDLYQSVDEKTVFQFDRSWHSCSCCITEDTEKYGSSYWHIKHQIPSVYKCHKHGTILDKAQAPVSDLRSGVLPHQIKKWQKLVLNETKAIIDWQIFVFNMYEKSLGNKEIVFDIQAKIQRSLGVDRLTTHQSIAHTEELTKHFNNDLDSDLLRYLFKDYARPSNKGEPKILRSLFGRINNPYKIRSPVIWLLLCYWLFPQELEE